MILISSPWRIPRPSYPLLGNFGRSGKGLFTEKSKNVNNSSLCTARESTCSELQCDLRSVFLDRVIRFGKILGDQVEGRSPKNLKSLIEVPYVLRVNVHVLIFNTILISSRFRVPRPSYPFWLKFVDQVKGRSPKKAKIVKRVSLCSAHESICSKLQ